ncbi:hypothetical protein F5Y14DRAFT_398239 [Nemania sp. NC0429]|nr:hypothetical protein F5Y14DRAFT_398239 [Nemania sp. NC0429]
MASSYIATMSAKHHDLAVVQRTVTSPHRPNHQLRRSITEQSPPFRQSLHQYLHRKDRERDDRLPQSAGPRTPGSLELPRAEVGAATDTSMAFWTGDELPNAKETGTNLQQSPHDHIAREQKQKQKAMAATASLQKSLVELDTFSNATIARLDETYSSVLDRLSSLQSTIVSMKELAAVSQELTESFTSESQTLISDIESQLSAYDQSADQKKRIQDLQARIRAGRDKVQALSKRVDVVRGRVESWEKADKEWQERTRRRLKVIWIFISVLLLILVFLFVGAQYALPSADINKRTEPGPGLQGEKLAMMETPNENKSSSAAAAMADEVRQELARRRGNEQEVLHVFDEL